MVKPFASSTMKSYELLSEKWTHFRTWFSWRVTSTGNRKSLLGQNMERQNSFLLAKVWGKGVFYLFICLICTQNIRHKIGLETRSRKKGIGLRREVEFWKLMLIKSRFKWGSKRWVAQSKDGKERYRKSSKDVQTTELKYTIVIREMQVFKI